MGAENYMLAGSIDEPNKLIVIESSRIVKNSLN